jgi:hypothetical protein
MQVRRGTLQRLGPGQVFYESPEDIHTVSRNASKTKRSSSYFLSNATYREWDRGCPSVRTVCARSLLFYPLWLIVLACEGHMEQRTYPWEVSLISWSTRAR